VVAKLTAAKYMVCGQPNKKTIKELKKVGELHAPYMHGFSM